MLRLMALEIKKIKVKGYVIAVFMIILGLCWFSTIAIYGSMQDNSNTFVNIFRLVNTVVLEAFMIFSSIIMSKIVIEEYSSKTITIMFLYPVRREKLIFSKLCLVSICTILCVLLGTICCILYLILFDYCFDKINGTFFSIDLLYFILYNFLGVVMSGVFSLIPFCFGMIKKSVSATIVSSIFAVCLMQVIISQTASLKEYSLLLLICSIITIAFTTFIFNKRINNLDD